MTNENSRYDRQQRIKNWQQEKLTDARVAIVGTGQLAQFTAMSLVALGIGKVELYESAKREPGFLSRSSGETSMHTLEKRLQEINPEAQVKGIEMEKDHQMPSLAGRYDLILDLTNSPGLKERVMDYAAQQGVTVISASTARTSGEAYFIKPGEAHDPAMLSGYAGEKQGAFSSEVLSGMITEEVRKTLMPLGKEEAVAKLAYNAAAERRFSREADFNPQPFEDLSQKKILIVGAGALGNFVALGAALEGIGSIDILDFDEVEHHNLNRQVLFYDAVGKAKASALAEKIKEINPEINARGLVEKLDENTTYFQDHKPDLILDCVDSFATRAITNYFAVHYGIPVVSGGTNAQSGQVVVYEPGYSACLECKLGVEKALGVALQGNKCTNEPDPSVIMTNEIVGGMMVGEALKVLDKGYGAPVSRILKHDASVPVRGGLVGASDACECTRGDIHNWLGDLKKRFSSMKKNRT